MKKPGKAYYMISAVAQKYNIHAQTLRLYEREGLLKPSRTEGNTRLYSEEDLEQLEVILSLTRDMGVNLAGVEIILNMRRRISSRVRSDDRVDVRAYDQLLFRLLSSIARARDLIESADVLRAVRRHG